MPKIELFREAPNEELKSVPWDDGAIKRFHFDSTEVDLLNEGNVIWRGNTAFYLEKEEEQTN